MKKYRPLSEQGIGRMLSALSGGDLAQYLPLIGRKLMSVEVESDKTVLAFRFEDGDVRYDVEGDCCSRSWIEHIELPSVLSGAEVLTVSEAPVIDATEDDTQNPVTKPDDEYFRREHECLQVYQTVFGTTKGEIAVEYRNSSNGYYGGSLEIQPLTCPRCKEQINNRYNAGEHSKCFGVEDSQ